MSAGAQVPITLEVRDKAVPYSVDEYRAALASWIQHFEQSQGTACCFAPAEGLPRQIVVKAPEHDFKVDLPDLQRYEVDKDTSVEEAGKKNREFVLTRLRALQASLAEWEQQPAISADTAKRKAEQILAAREYRQVRTPGMKERWRDKFMDWLRDRLSRIFDKSPDFAFIGRVLVWTVVLIAVAVAGIFIYRMMQREEKDPRWQLGGTPLPVSAKPWHVWLQEGRQAAAGNDWRQAVRLAYWAGISALESRGEWKPDKARTPREYLKLVANKEQTRKPLASLTRDFERIWYAQQPATQGDFESALLHLGDLGCR